MNCPVYFLKIYFGSQIFILDDLILIEGQLIWIFYARVKLKEYGPKIKSTKHEWNARSFEKGTLWSFNFKLTQII